MVLTVEQLETLSGFLWTHFKVRSYVWSHDVCDSKALVWCDPLLVILCEPHGLILFDERFADKFRSQHHTPEGLTLFCGTQSELVTAVLRWGRELEKSFTDKGLPIPPWRRTRNILALYRCVFGKAAAYFSDLFVEEEL